MQNDPHYDDVVKEVCGFLTERANTINKQGNSNLIIDPGFGFGKTIQHNYELLRHLDCFHESGNPVMVGVSRKSMINRIIRTNPETALNGSTVLHTLALLKGANILRVHDVREAEEAVQLVKYYVAEK
jgi:dihydropteroate synthase